MKLSSHSQLACGRLLLGSLACCWRRCCCWRRWRRCWWRSLAAGSLLRWGRMGVLPGFSSIELVTKCCQQASVASDRKPWQAMASQLSAEGWGGANWRGWTEAGGWRQPIDAMHADTPTMIGYHRSMMHATHASKRFRL